MVLAFLFIREKLLKISLVKNYLIRPLREIYEDKSKEDLIDLIMLKNGQIHKAEEEIERLNSKKGKGFSQLVYASLILLVFFLLLYAI